MPSLWKKQKGNRISRLVADIQTTPKKGGSLVVETGFPTSLVDLFHKNKDKLRKPSKKKQRSKKHKSSSTTEDLDDDHPFPILPSVSHPHISLSNSEEPISPNDDDDNNKKIVIYNVCDDDHEMFADQNNTQKNYDVKLNKNGDFDRDDYCKGVIYSKIVYGLCILIGICVAGVSLYNKKFVWGISSGALLLLSLEYVGNKVFRWSKCCEGVFILSILKGALIVFVAMYSKRFVEGIIIGAVLLFVLECVIGKSGFRSFKPCDDGEKDLRGWDRIKKRRVVEEIYGRGNGKGVLIEEGDGESKMGVEKDCGNGVVQSEVEQDVGNGGAVIKEIEAEVDNYRGVEEVGNGSSLKGDIELIGKDSAAVSGNSCFVKEEKPSPISEIEVIEQNYSVWPREIDDCGSAGYCEMPGKKGKGKKGKGKKFWKKLVPKHIRKKKKNKHKKENQEARNECVQEDTKELEEVDDNDDDDDDTADMEESLTVSSDDEEEVTLNYNPSAVFPPDEVAYTSYKMISVKDRNLKCLALMVIPLAGLVRGRMFALILTVICCVVFKMIRG